MSSSAPIPTKPTESFFKNLSGVFGATFNNWLADKSPQLGAALAYYTIFSLAPLMLVLLAVFGWIYGSSPDTRQKVVHQLYTFLDPNGARVIQNIADSTVDEHKGALATTFGIIIALFGASAVFAQLQDSLNTIWRIKAKPGSSIRSFLRARISSGIMIAGVLILLFLSLILSTFLNGYREQISTAVLGGSFMAWFMNLLLDFIILTLMFGMIFKVLPDAQIHWHDVRLGAALTAVLFILGKYALAFYLTTSRVGLAYGTANSLISLLIWIYYSAQILLFGAEFTKVYAQKRGRKILPSSYAMEIPNSYS